MAASLIAHPVALGFGVVLGIAAGVLCLVVLFFALLWLLGRLF